MYVQTLQGCQAIRAKSPLLRRPAIKAGLTPRVSQKNRPCYLFPFMSYSRRAINYRPSHLLAIGLLGLAPPSELQSGYAPLSPFPFGGM